MPIRIGVTASGSVRSRAAPIQSPAVAFCTRTGLPDSRTFCGFPRDGCFFGPEVLRFLLGVPATR